ncbi:MAG: YeaH/YhbH family protein [Thalassospira sp.]|uniref:YeaH/YhbH family protein n=1 Tax=Thalassospira sp. TaxID=1912094 RepID=UPI001B085707|nr:YeaH/YhbH family protein [Thalassospira sp.]MBO6579782.1 YeaH/YhbH family protein [Thalassospira sp.]MBO6803884.1 YeaH/YhbH family protein [Thalassospira sp.]MBO6819895.1 YeaH/YhbH family protein [Thalassospira sp.]MBO6889362.1 YeaH/YhbH family protein [Thalassospira sp.]
MLYIVDRRKNPTGKSLGNRQRFMRRAKAQIKKAVESTIRSRGITDISSGDQITIPGKTLKEPGFHHMGRGGNRNYVLPGNKKFVQGDRIARPQGGDSGSGGSQASPDGEGEDEFQFTLTRDEFLDIFFEDLELPDLLKKSLKQTTAFRNARAGFSVEGTPSNLNLVRTMRNSLARRIGLRRPKTAEVRELEEKISVLQAKAEKRPNGKLTKTDEETLHTLLADLEEAKRRMKAIPFIDPIDTRFNQFQQIPDPNTQAVMFCLMDVSGSMSEQMKELAKRFFMLLHLFLHRKYEHVEVVFIRHTSRAAEVDEETFFYSRETGGTIVSTALEEMKKVLVDRYPTDQWNIYAAQASDGDNYSNDGAKCTALLAQDLLPKCQYYAYIEITDEREAEIFAAAEGETALWKSYAPLARDNPRFALKRVTKAADIFPVFRELFAKNRAEAGR